MPLKSPGHSTYFGVVDEFYLFRINAPIYSNVYATFVSYIKKYLSNFYFCQSQV